MPLTAPDTAAPRGCRALGPAGDRQARRLARWAKRREALDRYEAASCKAAESSRVTLCYGPHLIGWYPPDGLAEVLADVARWAADPGYFAELPWPRCCQRRWEWNAGEHLAVWQAGRLLAVVVKTAAGDVALRRFAEAL